MKIDIITTVEVDTAHQADEIAKIFKLPIEKGALQGVRGGSTGIHFDGEGKFRTISLNYVVWKEAY